MTKPNAFFIFVPGFPANEADTHIVPPVYRFCTALKRNFPDMEFIVFTFQYPFEARSYRLAGLQVHAFGGRNKKGLFRLLLWFKIFRCAVSESRRYRLAGVLSFWLTECALIGKWFARFRSLPFKVWLQGQEVKRGNRYVRLVSPVPDEVVSFSEFVSDELRANYGITPVHKITNSIEPSMFPPVKEQHRTIDVIGCGWLNANKNFRLFVEVIEALIQKRSDLQRVLIVGGGEQQEILKNSVTEKGLSRLIGFTGHLPHHEVIRLMNDSRVLLHTSHFDSNASVLHEALFAGCRVVSRSAIDPPAGDAFVCATSLNELVAAVSLGLDAPLIGRVQRQTFDDAAISMMKLFSINR